MKEFFSSLQIGEVRFQLLIEGREGWMKQQSLLIWKVQFPQPPCLRKWLPPKKVGENPVAMLTAFQLTWVKGAGNLPEAQVLVKRFGEP